MTEPIDAHFIEQVTSWTEEDHDARSSVQPAAAQEYLDYFDAQIQSRHLDFASRWLRGQDQGFYTIGSAGHESNAAVARALRPTDPALLHYRSGGFYAARAAQVPGSTPIQDVLLGMAAAAADPISGGRHKVFGNRRLNIIPQTSTIASHLPRAVGVAFSLGRAALMGVQTPWPDDAVVVCSFGDASANHSTAVGALNSASYCAHRGLPMPILFVCEDNGIGISTKTPAGWLEQALSRYPGFDYQRVDGSDPAAVLSTAQAVADQVREQRRPAVLHLRTVRFMGHAGSDAELGYRSRTEILADHARDPILATARLLFDKRILTAAQLLDRYEEMRERVMAQARTAGLSPRLASSAQVTEPLVGSRVDAVAAAVGRFAEHRSEQFGGKLPEAAGELTLAQSINATLADLMALWPETIAFGEDVAVKGGVYGLTRGLRRKFGATRVFDTLLDEQTILGTALGAALCGLLPIPEIQYLAYLHNAEDQLRGEAATLRFFSNGQYRNGMVVRIAGLAYQKGFGGHFHNDNSVAVLRDIPGLVLAVPSHPADAPALLRSCVAMAREEGRVCVFLEPIARYHTRDLHSEDDHGWLAPYSGPDEPVENAFGKVKTYGDGTDVLLVTFGNGLFMSLRAARTLAAEGITCTVLDLRWLAPLPEAALAEQARHFDRILVVDETRRSGGVSEAVLTLLLDHGFAGTVERVTSVDSFIPLGAAADHVLLSEQQILDAARGLARRAADPQPPNAQPSIPSRSTT